MNDSVWHRIDFTARSLTPAALTVFLVLIAMVPVNLTGFSPAAPSVAMIAVFHWVVHRPELMPAWAVFLIGLFYDLVSGGNVGVGILALLMVYVVVDTQRRHLVRASFQGLWVTFALLAAVAIYFMWILNCILQDTWVAATPAFFQFLTTVAVYPCIAWLFAKAQGLFLR